MTLHWWMHWFWVTAQIVVSLSSPASNVTADPATLAEATSRPPPPPPTEAARMLTATEETLERLQQSYRIAKAIGIQPTTDAATVTAEPPGNGLRVANNTAAPPADPPARSTTAPLATDSPENRTTQVGRIPGKKESKITWVQAFSKPPRVKFEDKSTPPSTTPRHEPSPEELTVMPLREESGAAAPVQPDPNAIHREQQQLQPIIQANGNHTAASGELRLGEDTGEPHLVATAASVLEAGLGDSTRLGRARGAFTSEFQREQLTREEQRPEGHGEAAAAAKEGGANVTEIATITGSCLAVIVLLSTVGSLGFIMYRRRYLNPPQTLNSDKCSNPDSSGYIDDSTIRDNSEEMYSLDNDSFLNSLEAMTIQNYWTDSVKHTKL